MAFPYFTIGHSTRPIADFVDLLIASEIGIVVDVRTIPRSRTNPQYNRDALPGPLSDFQIAYEHIAELGGRRAHTREIAPDVNACWENQSFHNYADYAMGGNFRSGFARLRELGTVRRCAVMCAEVVWWRCHRRIIADYLLVAGEPIPPRRRNRARLTVQCCSLEPRTVCPVVGMSNKLRKHHGLPRRRLRDDR
jgi:uncharacterized protein (DUF488 family)